LNLISYLLSNTSSNEYIYEHKHTLNHHGPLVIFRSYHSWLYGREP